MSDINTPEYQGPERRKQDHEQFSAAVERIFGKFAFRFGWIIICITASAAIAWFSLTRSVDDARKQGDENAKLLQQTAHDFSVWQSTADTKLNGAMTKDQYDTAVGIAKYRDPKFPMPYMSEITANRR